MHRKAPLGSAQRAYISFEGGQTRVFVLNNQEKSLKKKTAGTTCIC